MNPSSPSFVFDVWGSRRLRLLGYVVHSILLCSLASINSKTKILGREQGHLNALSKCAKWQSEHNVIIQYSWGTLPIEMRKEWRKHLCDEKLLRYASEANITTPSTRSSVDVRVKADAKELFESSHADLSYRSGGKKLQGSLLDHIPNAYLSQLIWPLVCSY